MQELKTCSRCQMTKHRTAFWRHSWCKQCHASYYKDYRERRAQEREEASDATDDLYVLTFADPELARRFGAKVGRSSHPLKRAGTLASSLPMEFQIIATFPGKGKCERRIHHKLKNYFYSVGGCREWFSINPWTAVGVVAGALGSEDQTQWEPLKLEQL